MAITSCRPCSNSSTTATSLHFEARQDGQVRLHTEIAGVPHDSNLIVRAARGLQEASGSPQGVDIWLDKRLPMGAASAAAA